jgi:ABC-2 type transport system permease protein
MNSRLVSIIRKEFIQITRDARTLVIILIIPIMQLFLLGYAATNDVRNIPLAVLDQSQTEESRMLLDAYRAADYFRIAYSVDSEAEIQSLIEKGDARAGIIIPPDYATRLAEGDAKVAFILDTLHRLVQPGPCLGVFHDPGCDRHDPVRDHRHAYRHLRRARA